MKSIAYLLTLSLLLLASCITDEPNSNTTNLEPKRTKISLLKDVNGIAAMGASLISPENSWFLDACDSLNVTGYNNAVSGIGIPSYFAEKLWRNQYCTDDEFENIDVLVIQFANCKDIYTSDALKPTASDYTANFDINNSDNPFLKYSHAQNLDYILKFWQERCAAQEHNSDSKWFGISGGKPFKVMLVTHWHDARVPYNESIRKVAQKWNLPVCELDKNIGFSKDKPLADGTQVSVMYAADTEVIDGITYGWHPLRGIRGIYIQSRIAKTLVDALLNEYSYD